MHCTQEDFVQSPVSTGVKALFSKYHIFVAKFLISCSSVPKSSWCNVPTSDMYPRDRTLHMCSHVRTHSHLSSCILICPGKGLPSTLDPGPRMGLDPSCEPPAAAHKYGEPQVATPLPPTKLIRIVRRVKGGCGRHMPSKFSCCSY